MVTGFYTGLLDLFDTELRKKRLHLAKKTVLFHHDNAPVHTSIVATANVVELDNKLLSDPPNSSINFRICTIFKNKLKFLSTCISLVATF